MFSDQTKLFDERLMILHNGNNNNIYYFEYENKKN